jgi:alkanesulfonate monooxygenase SsuD/methylene tetrahydromethanopterin reductase-like flavin-dependent oxidoreductase (luciferase family)
MCSNACQEENGPAAVAAVLAQAIDELAATAGAGDDAQLAARLAGTWAMITAADPELAARTEKYSRRRNAGGARPDDGPSSPEVPSSTRAGG